ncbi:MAG: aminodeoxychorismate lyase, partial [Sedimenticola sp.]|nr:aminodeoxychorismate lyase [Sedimenticola sp.]
MLHRLLGIIVLIGSFAAAWFLMTLNDFSEMPLALPETGLIYELPAGSSLSAVAKDLEKQGYIKSALYFQLIARWDGQAGKIKAGEYQL